MGSGKATAVGVWSANAVEADLVAVQQAHVGAQHDTRCCRRRWRDVQLRRWSRRRSRHINIFFYSRFLRINGQWF